MTPKKRLEASDLFKFRLSNAKSVHIICSPSRCIEICRALRDTVEWIVWEPVPDLCTPKTKAEMLAACAMVDIISPNESELAEFFEVNTGVEAQAHILLEAGPRAGVVVRAGKRGCYVLTQTRQVWLPAYWEGELEDHERVVDSTGGGNTFLGALAVGLVSSSGDVVSAAAKGNVAASFAVEQIGLPVLHGSELWNGESAEGRLQRYTDRLESRRLC